ncbi:MAG: T9SS type A sorting domain-containing protein [candidate division Zixibacteria bacterium]|nr:T9SS type A sorting domain-containing protein [candidate division Zixibacteria bacterium]MDH3938093.1 T9SS type A sorting domain-containing protein [candidate division Zixibacteria bacterium]MDH4032243.1 T9SS type A sorting domain-containing protein [candidate division Zixibacteria bacterium]
MNKRYTIGSLAIGLVLMLALAVTAGVTPTPWYKGFIGEAFYNGQPAPQGSKIDAYDPDGVHCGSFTVGANYDTVGIFGMLFAYGDDIYSDDIDEGALTGDLITFTVNHRNPSTSILDGDLYWQDKAQAEVNLSVDDAVMCLSPINLPADRIGKPNSIVRVEIDVRNCGNGLDFYTVEAISTKGWSLNIPSGFTYAASGEVVSVYFDVSLPIWPGSSESDRIDTVEFAVTSELDASETTTGSLQVTVDASDVYAIELTDPPIAKEGQPEEWVQFVVGVRNVGNVFDEYSITAESDLGWGISVETKGLVNANPGEEVYLSFEVLIPTDAPDGAADLLSYTVNSLNDVSVFVDGEVLLTSHSPTDVGDDGAGLLPNSIQLAQNYPNPFNPSTTISYTLPSRSRVSLAIYDVLGRAIEQIDLGTMPSGTHEVEYDGSSLASGVYFYRLVTDLGQETRKMVLLK